MTRISKYLAVVAASMVVSCHGGVLLTLGSTYTLQGVVADAVTGARLGNGVSLYLVQGPDVRGPSRFMTSGDLTGEYAFTGIPVDISGSTATPQNIWKVVAVKQGYQRFESEVHFVASPVDTSTTNADEVVQQVFSKIGNIFMFPEGVAAPDYTFSVTFNNKPVAGATVQLDPITASNTQVFSTGGAADTLPATNGYVASLAQVTGADGKAVFPGANLSVGAAYKIQVLPFQFKETATSTPIQLGLLNLPTGTLPLVIAGLSSVNQPLTLADLTPATTAAPIFIVSASNQPLDSIQSNGTLVLTFNLPVSLVNPNNFGAAITAGTNAAGTGPTAATLNTQPVNASLDSTGTILTLAPNYATPPAAGDRNVQITYSAGTASISPKDYPTLTINPFTLHFNDGTTTPSGVVHVTAP